MPPRSRKRQAPDAGASDPWTTREPLAPAAKEFTPPAIYWLSFSKEALQSVLKAHHIVVSKRLGLQRLAAEVAEHQIAADGRTCIDAKGETQPTWKEEPAPVLSLGEGQQVHPFA